MRALETAHRNVVVFCETGPLPHAPFPTQHEFETERDRYEWESWFGGTPAPIGTLATTRAFDTLNERVAVQALAEYAADLTFVFGTGVLKPPVVEMRPDRMLNLHGGDPERYRGLDTHLWAIYHREFDGLVTTLHHLGTGIDTGDIVLQQSVAVTPHMRIHELRRANAEACVALAMAAIEMVRDAGVVAARPLRARGRYYSAMPAVLTDLCKVRFEAHTARLTGRGSR